jgi:predicted RNA-binding Zn-ribbon protein involved in translation (DUF1610 family)
MPRVHRVDAADSPDDPGAWYVVQYTCPDCGEEWETHDQCVTDEECPECGARDVEARAFRQC